MPEPVYVHPKGICEAEDIGPGTRIWAFAHVMKGAHIGSECNIGEGAFVESGAVLGDRVTVKNGVCVWDGVTVEEGAFLGPGCILTNRRRPRSRQGRGQPKEPWDPILIRRGASIGAGAVLVCPLEVGRFALVGAGAVVTGDVPDYGLVVGNPARRTGWVCRCGAGLDPELRCRDCNRAYAHNSKGGLSPK